MGGGLMGNPQSIQQAIAAITRKLVATCQPLRIYLFGSVARGDNGPDSDLDFLMVVADDAPDAIFRGSVIDQALREFPLAADVIRQSDFDGRAAFVAASLPATVVREGRVLYDARHDARPVAA
jgi:predicted nucleotidyltransferase